ncbi:MAG: hypothetical protein EXR71_11950 [Myxococcales bacterium]|nr:hypothetical protein [Myxococcales bacterium]
MLQEQDCDDADASVHLPADTFVGNLEDADLDAFCVNYCTRSLDGHLWAYEVERVDFSALSCLDSVSGDVGLEGPNLVSLAGLESLARVGGELSIASDRGISDLSALGGLSEVGSLSIYGESITSLAGLEGIRNVPGSLFIGYTSITDLRPLSALTSVGVYLSVADNPKLTSMGGMSSLVAIGGAVIVANNPALLDLDAFAWLTELDELWVVGNASLPDLQGLASLQRVNGLLAFDGNQGLLSFAGLESLTEVGTELVFAGGPVLDGESLIALTAVGGRMSLQSDFQEELTGFNALTRVGGLGIRGNTVLTEVSGFGSLTAVTGDVEISYNPALLRLPDFAIADIGGDLDVVDNDSLTTLAGLESVRTVGGALTLDGNETLMDVTALWDVESVDSLVITDNPALANDYANDLWAEIPNVVSGVVTISGNGP